MINDCKNWLMTVKSSIDNILLFFLEASGLCGSVISRKENELVMLIYQTFVVVYRCAK